MPDVVLNHPVVGRKNSMGCWTGWVADMQLIKLVRHKTTPETFLENYPRGRAMALNTWLFRFGMYSNGTFLELDMRGSGLVKELIKRSGSNCGFLIRVEGYRNGDKLVVKEIVEVPKAAGFTDPDLARMAKLKLRGEFGRMGI